MTFANDKDQSSNILEQYNDFFKPNIEAINSEYLTADEKEQAKAFLYNIKTVLEEFEKKAKEKGYKITLEDRRNIIEDLNKQQGIDETRNKPSWKNLFKNVSKLTAKTAPLALATGGAVALTILGGGVAGITAGIVATAAGVIFKPVISKVVDKISNSIKKSYNDIKNDIQALQNPKQYQTKDRVKTMLNCKNEVSWEGIMAKAVAKNPQITQNPQMPSNNSSQEKNSWVEIVAKDPNKQYVLGKF